MFKFDCDKTMCRYLKFCILGGEGCEASETAECDEFKRKEEIYNSACPVMTKLGYTGEISKCDIPELKALLPSELSCCQNGKCIRELKPQLRELVQKIMSGKADKQLLRQALHAVSEIKIAIAKMAGAI